MSQHLNQFLLTSTLSLSHKTSIQQHTLSIQSRIDHLPQVLLFTNQKSGLLGPPTAWERPSGLGTV